MIGRLILGAWLEGMMVFVGKAGECLYGSIEGLIGLLMPRVGVC